MKILVIQNRMGIGDNIIFLPFIKAISKKFNSPVSILIKENSKADQYLGHTSYISEIIFLKEIKKKGYSRWFKWFLQISKRYKELQF